MADYSYGRLSVSYTPSNTCSSSNLDSVVVDSPPMSPAARSGMDDTGSPMSISSLESAASPNSFHANDAEESPSPLGLTSLSCSPSPTAPEPDEAEEEDEEKEDDDYHRHHEDEENEDHNHPSLLRLSTSVSPSAFSTSSQDSYPEYETWNDNVLSSDSFTCWRSRWSRDKEGNMIALRDWDIHSNTLHSSTSYSSSSSLYYHSSSTRSTPRSHSSSQKAKPYRRPTTTFASKPDPTTNSHHVNNSQWSLWEATRTGSVTQLKSLLLNPPSKMQVNAVGADGDAVLHLCCRQGNLEMVQLLICHGANVSLANREGWTPLHIAAYYGWSDIANYLLSVAK